MYKIEHICSSNVKIGGLKTELWKINGEEYFLNQTFAKTKDELMIKLDEIKKRLESNIIMYDLKIPYLLYPILFEVFSPQIIMDYIEYGMKLMVKEKKFISKKAIIKFLFGRIDTTLPIPKCLHHVLDELISKEFRNSDGSNMTHLENRDFVVQLIGSQKPNLIWDINGRRVSIPKKSCRNSDQMIGLLEEIKERLVKRIPMPDLSKSPTTIAKLLTIVFSQQLIEEYIAYHAKVLANKGVKSERELGSYLFSRQYDYFQRVEGNIKEIVRRLFLVEYQQYNQIAIKENRNIKIDKDKWTIYHLIGNTRRTINLDFSTIGQIGIRKEVKYYCYEKIKNMVDSNGMLRGNPHAVLIPLKIGFLFFEQNYPVVKYCANINQTMVRALLKYLETNTNVSKKISLKSMSQVITYLGELVDYVAEHSKTIGTLTPLNNWFTSIKMNNIDNMSKKTEYIPEEVVQGLLKNIDNLPLIHQRSLIIMLNCGLRYKEVCYLEDECLKYDYKTNTYVLRYIPYKVLESRRFHGLGDYHYIAIKKHVANEIDAQVKDSMETRVKYGLKQIFLNDKGFKATITGVGVFLAAINGLIKNYNITDSSGNLWHFTTKQCRKTLAVDMISNGAKPVEVQNYLGHLYEPTTLKYYAEVRKMKLADMNAEFFRRKFESYVSEEQLLKYTEEERKILYVEFCLGYREVELGICMKKYEQGLCSKRIGKPSCATCTALITGPQKLPKLRSLLNSQENQVKNLIEGYIKNGIYEFGEYREYQKEKYLLDVYQGLVSEVIKYTEEGSNYGEV